MWCSKWLSIQSSPAHVTQVDWLCVSQESKRFDATRTLVRSTLLSTRASLPDSRQIHRTNSTRTPNERPRFTLASGMDSPKHLRWRELLRADAVTPGRPSFFVSLPSSAAFQRVAPAFAVLGQFL